MSDTIVSPWYSLEPEGHRVTKIRKLENGEWKEYDVEISYPNDVPAEVVDMPSYVEIAPDILEQLDRIEKKLDDLIERFTV